MGQGSNDDHGTQTQNETSTNISTTYNDDHSTRIQNNTSTSFNAIDSSEQNIFNGPTTIVTPPNAPKDEAKYKKVLAVIFPSLTILIALIVGLYSYLTTPKPEFRVRHGYVSIGAYNYIETYSAENIAKYENLISDHISMYDGDHYKTIVHYIVIDLVGPVVAQETKVVFRQSNGEKYIANLKTFDLTQKAVLPVEIIDMTTYDIISVSTVNEAISLVEIYPVSIECINPSIIRLLGKTKYKIEPPSMNIQSKPIQLFDESKIDGLDTSRFISFGQ